MIRAQHVISTRALVSVPRVRKSLAGYSLKNIIIFFKEPASDLCNSSFQTPIKIGFFGK